jgi:hypothetical protein
MKGTSATTADARQYQIQSNINVLRGRCNSEPAVIVRDPRAAGWKQQAAHG